MRNLEAKTMRIVFAAATAVVLVCGVARADELTNLPSEPDAGLSVGVGVICNTNEQAARFVDLREHGAKVTPAMLKVNRAAKDPRACGLAAIAFQRGKTVAATSLQGKLVTIVRVNVLAGYDGHHWSRVPPMVQYAIMEAKGGLSI
jgi:hypothetical protein